MGMPYVPGTMRRTLHEGEAVLTKQQAEVWRSQVMNLYLQGNIYGMGGYRAFIEEALREAARYAV